MNEMKFVTLHELADSRQFFELKLPGYYRFFIGTMVLILVAAFGWLLLAELDIMIATEAVIRPAKVISEVVATNSGIIWEKTVLPGQKVEKGQLLFKLDNSTQVRESNLNNQNLETLRKRKKDLLEFRNFIPLGTTLQSWILTDHELEARRLYISGNVRQLEKDIQQAARELELEKSAPSTVYLKQKVEEKEYNLEKTKSNLEWYLLQEKIKLETELSGITNQLTDLENRQNQLRKQLEETVLKAAIDGTWEELYPLNPGDYMVSGTTLGRILPENPKEIKVLFQIKPADISKLKNGDPFILKTNGLPVTEFGYVTGNVSYIPPDIQVSGRQGPNFFIIEGIPDSYFLKDKKGEIANLRPGMDGSAKIHVGKRRALIYFLEKLNFLW